MSMAGKTADRRTRTELIKSGLSFTAEERAELLQNIADRAGELELEISATLALIKNLHQVAHLLLDDFRKAAENDTRS